MFTVIALIAVPVLVWICQRQEQRERSVAPPPIDDDFARRRIIYIREEIRLVCFLLMAILVMLGIIADRLH